MVLLIAYASAMHFYINKKNIMIRLEESVKENAKLSEKLMRAVGCPDYIEKMGCLLPVFCSHVKEIILHSLLQLKIGDVKLFLCSYMVL